MQKSIKQLKIDTRNQSPKYNQKVMTAPLSAQKRRNGCRTAGARSTRNMTARRKKDPEEQFG